MSGPLQKQINKTPPLSAAAKTSALPKKKPGLNLPGFGFGFLFKEKPPNVAFFPNEENEIARNQRIRNLLWWQAVVISVLVSIILIGAPVFQPTHKYIALIPPEKERGEIKGKQLAPLDMPNLTNQALLSWVVTSVTEIMTLGFGDFEKQLVSQKKRFTKGGWESFKDALFERGLRDVFKSRQLVLTTVPSNAPVVVAQGPDPEGVYQWIVEMPIILTFATNNNVSTKQKNIVRLTIVRVPAEQSLNGIAIKIWKIM